MVATRSHPQEFPPAPTESPSKRSTRPTSSNNAAAPGPSNTSAPQTPTRAQMATPSSASTPRWSHTPSNITLIWLAISLPLVIWDTGYVFLRPYSMPGGSLHSPIWTPYALYGTIDYVYGWKAYNEHNGFTSAQGALNAAETVGYLVYLWIVYAYGQQTATKGRGAPEKSTMGSLKALSEARVVRGHEAAWAVLLGYSAAMVTFSKTVLYWLNEYFSGFANVGHNDWSTLVLLWVIPNGPWIIFSGYMIYVFATEILQGLETAAGDRKKDE